MMQEKMFDCKKMKMMKKTMRKMKKKSPSLMKNEMDIVAFQKKMKIVVIDGDDSLRDDDNESDV